MTEKTVQLQLSQDVKLTMPYAIVHYFRTLETMLADLGEYDEGLVIPIHASPERCISSKHLGWIIDIYTRFEKAEVDEKLWMRYDAAWCLNHLSPSPALDELVCVIKFLSFMDAPLMRGWLMKSLAQRYKEAIGESMPEDDVLSWEAQRRLLSPLWRRLRKLRQALDQDLQQELWQALNMGAPVACGDEHSLFLTDDGLYVTGRNLVGQLGNGTKKMTKVPLKINIVEATIKQLVCGTICSFVLTDEALLGAGRGDGGQLGLDVEEHAADTFTAVPLPPQQQIRGCSSGANHSFVWTERTVMGTGHNRQGQLGTMLYEERQSKRVVESTVVLQPSLYKVIGQVGHFMPLKLPLEDTEVVQCVACAAHSTYVVIRREDGVTRLLVCGVNDNGELGTGATVSRAPFLIEVDAPQNIAQIACGKGRCLLLTQDGHLYATGDNRLGQAGLGDLERTHVFTRIEEVPIGIAQLCCGETHTLLLTREGELWGTGTSGSKLGLVQQSPVRRFVHLTTAPPHLMYVAAGERHTIVVDRHGRFYGTGSSLWGQLGLGEGVDFAGGFTTLSLLPSNTTKTKDTDVTQRLYCVQCGIGCYTALQDERCPDNHYCSLECFNQRYDFAARCT